jgi:hypothetical protein
MLAFSAFQLFHQLPGSCIILQHSVGDAACSAVRSEEPRTCERHENCIWMLAKFKPTKETTDDTDTTDQTMPGMSQERMPSDLILSP